MKDVNIEYEEKVVRVPCRIEVDGKSYPITKRNVSIVAEYEAAKDDRALDRLSDVVLDFG